MIAPTLAELKGEKGKVNSMSSNGDYAGRESLSLEQMMALPEDADSSEHNYRSLAKDLDAMTHLPVDEGHEDEEAGYDCFYLSGQIQPPEAQPRKNARDL